MYFLLLRLQVLWALTILSLCMAGSRFVATQRSMLRLVACVGQVGLVAVDVMTDLLERYTMLNVMLITLAARY